MQNPTVFRYKFFNHTVEVQVAQIKQILVDFDIPTSNVSVTNLQGFFYSMNFESNFETSRLRLYEKSWGSLNQAFGSKSLAFKCSKENFFYETPNPYHHQAELKTEHYSQVSNNNTGTMKQVKRSFTNTSRRNFRGLNFLKKGKKEKKEKKS